MINCFSVLIQWVHLMPCYLQISFQKTKIPLTSSPWFFLPSPGIPYFLSVFPSCCSKTKQARGTVIGEFHLSSWRWVDHWSQKAKWNYQGKISDHLLICLSASGRIEQVKEEEDGAGPSFYKDWV